MSDSYPWKTPIPKLFCFCSFCCFTSSLPDLNKGAWQVIGLIFDEGDLDGLHSKIIFRRVIPVEIGGETGEEIELFRISCDGNIKVWRNGLDLFDPMFMAHQSKVAEKCH